MIFVGLAGVAGAAIAYPLILLACVLAALAFHTVVEKPTLQVLSRYKSAGKRPKGMAAPVNISTRRL
jgi:peptidoglycan/LPS O-acetylase OafA/YrhL